jgi:hypothetical protein
MKIHWIKHYSTNHGNIIFKFKLVWIIRTNMRRTRIFQWHSTDTSFINDKQQKCWYDIFIQDGIQFVTSNQIQNMLVVASEWQCLDLSFFNIVHTMYSTWKLTERVGMNLGYWQAIWWDNFGVFIGDAAEDWQESSFDKTRKGNGSARKARRYLKRRECWR